MTGTKFALFLGLSFLTNTAMATGYIIELFGIAAIFNSNGSFLSAIGVVGGQVAIYALPLTFISGAIYLFGKSQSWNREQGIKKAQAIVEENVLNSIPKIKTAISKEWEKLTEELKKILLNRVKII